MKQLPELVAVRNLKKGDILRTRVYTKESKHLSDTVMADLVYSGMDGAYAKFLLGDEIINLGGNVEWDSKQGVYVLPKDKGDD